MHFLMEHGPQMLTHTAMQCSLVDFKVPATATNAESVKCCDGFIF